MRNVTTVFTRPRPAGSSDRKAQGSVQTAASGSKPPRKRCLNEGAHKLYR
jgi:hypothetical protein